LQNSLRPAFSIINLRSDAWGAQRLTRQPLLFVFHPAYLLTTASTKETAVVFLLPVDADQTATILPQKIRLITTKK